MQAIWPALGGHAWSPQASKLIAALHTKLRAHGLQLLSRSYSTISPAKAAVLLGASEAELQPCELQILAIFMPFSIACNANLILPLHAVFLLLLTGLNYFWKGSFVHSSQSQV